MKVTIFTIANIRPDFIEIQYDSIKKFLKDLDFEYIVFNNSFNNPKRYQIIEQICQKIKVKSIKVNHFRDYNNNAASLIVSNSLNDMWKNHLCQMKDMLFYIDSDMFLIKETSVNKLMENYNLGFVPNYRGKNFEVKYIWTGLMFFNMNTLPNPQEIKWNKGVILNHNTDVGGVTHYYLRKYKDKINILNLEMWNLNEFKNNKNRTKSITGSLNGNISFNLKLNKDNKLIEFKTNDFYISDKQYFPYQKNNNEILAPKVAENYIKFYRYFKERGIKFPEPMSVDLFKAEKNNFEDCFIFHYKSGSNWTDFATKSYNKQKSDGLCKLMNKLGVKSNFKLIKQQKTFFVEEDNQHMFKSNKIKILIKKVITKLKHIKNKILKIIKNYENT